MKNKISKITIILFFTLIIIKKDVMYITIYNTTITWFKNIVPNLFPMLIISALIINSNLITNICNIVGKPFSKLFKTNKYSIFVYSLSLISGCPSNAKYIKNLLDNNLINNEEANKLLTFTTNYNPLLIINLLTLYLPKNISYKILFITILSNIIVGLLYRNLKYNIIKNTQYRTKKINISTIIKDTTDTLLMILGTLIFFNIIINLLPINNLVLKNILNGILEITTALSNLKYLNISINFKIILTIIYLSFGGLSIHTQIKSILPDTNYNLFIKSRILCILISIILCIIII